MKHTIKENPLTLNSLIIIATICWAHTCQTLVLGPFTYIIKLFNHKSPMRYMLLLSPFYRWIKTTVKYSQKSVSIVTSVTSSIRTAITRGPADQVTQSAFYRWRSQAFQTTAGNDQGTFRPSGLSASCLFGRCFMGLGVLGPHPTLYSTCLTPGPDEDWVILRLRTGYLGGKRMIF